MFFSDKVIVILIQFTALEGRVIHGTLLSFWLNIYLVRLEFKSFDVVGNQFWTATNIADGLTALTTCIEVRSIINLTLYPWGPSEPPFSLFFQNLDGLVFYLDVVGLHTQWIQARERITGNEYLETNLGFVRFFFFFADSSRCLILIILFSFAIPTIRINISQYSSACFWQMIANNNFKNNENF